VVCGCCQDFFKGCRQLENLCTYIHAVVLGVSQQWLWRVPSSGIKHRVIGESQLTCQRNMFLAWLTLVPWRWRQHVPLKHRLTFTRLHSIISQKMDPIHINHLRLSSLMHPGKGGESISEVGTPSYPVGTRSCSFMVRGEHTNTSPLATLNYCYIERLFPVLVMCGLCIW
jgi:hypothetical protein